MQIHVVDLSCGFVEVRFGTMFVFHKRFRVRVQYVFFVRGSMSCESGLSCAIRGMGFRICIRRTCEVLHSLGGCHVSAKHSTRAAQFESCFESLLFRGAWRTITFVFVLTLAVQAVGQARELRRVADLKAFRC